MASDCMNCPRMLTSYLFIPAGRTISRATIGWRLCLQLAETRWMQNFIILLLFREQREFGQLDSHVMACIVIVIEVCINDHQNDMLIIVFVYMMQLLYSAYVRLLLDYR